MQTYLPIRDIHNSVKENDKLLLYLLSLGQVIQYNARKDFFFGTIARKDLTKTILYLLSLVLKTILTIYLLSFYCIRNYSH